jgi:hypothetical protein
MIPFFPNDKAAMTIISKMLKSMVETDEQLEWLTETACTEMARWGSDKYTGIKQLRGLYCQHHRPFDGIEADCDIPGYRPSDSEAGYAARIRARDAAALLEAAKELKLSPEEIAENKRANEELLRLGQVNVKAVPESRPEDREYVEKLHAGLVPPEQRDSAKAAVPVIQKAVDTKKLKEIEDELAAAPKKPLRSEEERIKLETDLAQRIGYKPDGKKP